MEAFVTELFQLVLIPLLGIVTTYLVKWLRAQAQSLAAKSNNTLQSSCIMQFEEIVSTCVIATNQTYVDSLKKQGSFDLEAQKEAFKKTRDTIMAILPFEVLECLKECTDDFEAYLTNSIEAQIRLNK